MHQYRTHTCGALRAGGDAGQHGAAVGLGAQQAGSWRAAVRRFAGSVWADAMRVCRGGAPAFEVADRDAAGKCDHGDRVGWWRAMRATANPRAGDRRVTVELAGRSEIEVQSARPTCCLSRWRGEEKFPEDLRLRYRFIDLRRDRSCRRTMILLRSRCDCQHSAADDRGGVHRVSDTDPDRVFSPEGARDFLVPSRLQSGDVLCVAAGAAAVQAAVRWWRGWTGISRSRRVFATRALRAGRTLELLPARFRDELRDAGGCVRDHRAGVGGACSRSFRADGKTVDEAAVSADRRMTQAMLDIRDRTSRICAIRW